MCDRLPDDLAEQVKSVMQAAYRLPWKEGRVRLRKQAEWLEGLHPDAAASLREGLEETFTINRLELSSSLRLCLASTNLIESPHSGVRMQTRRVSRWKDSQMVLRWAASAFLETEKNFRRIQGGLPGPLDAESQTQRRGFYGRQTKGGLRSCST